LADHGAPSAVKNALDWTFVSDPTTLNGASREQLRHRFRDWRKTAMQAENQRRDPATPIRSIDIPQRYTYFIQVDEESLNSAIKGGHHQLDADRQPLRREHIYAQLPGSFGSDTAPGIECGL
jgi:hypothetical protein